MKKNLNLPITFLLGIAIIAGSCKKFLDETPLTQVPTSDYYKSLKDVNAAMAGMYGSFQTEMVGNGTGFTGNYFYWGEGRSDDFDRSAYPNTTITELSLNQLTSGNASADWTGLYRTIGRANTNIQSIPKAQAFDNNVTNTVINNNLAQCYAMRALCYFYIVRVWGDAPMWTEPYTDITQEASRARTPKNEVLDSVVSDLQKAYTLIQKNQTAVVWNINEASIAAMMADVALWRKDYANTLTWIERVFIAKGQKGTVLGSTNTALEPSATWKNLFISPTTTNENLWSLAWDYNFNGCGCLPISIGLSNNPVRVDSVIHTDWKRITVDIRPKWTYDTLVNVGHWDKVVKYYNVIGNTIPAAVGSGALVYNTYLVMYRLGDVFLSYAEALNKTGDKANALKFLNYIRVRAGLTALLASDPSIATVDNMEDVILKERQYELFAEGKRWFDLVRTNHVNKVMDPILIQRQLRYAPGSPATGFGSDQNKLLWPLNRNLLEYNKKLVQNPSYN